MTGVELAYVSLIVGAVFFFAAVLAYADLSER